MRNLLALAVLALSSTPVCADDSRITWMDLRYANVARQGLEPSCAAASVVTILNSQFDEELDEFEVWTAYVLALNEAEQAVASDQGLSVADIVQLVAGLGYRAYPVEIDLLELDRVDHPAIVYIERDGAQAFRHFAVFDGIDGQRVLLRDPSLGNRRVGVETFMRQWTGYAIFIDRL